MRRLCSAEQGVKRGPHGVGRAGVVGPDGLEYLTAHPGQAGQDVQRLSLVLVLGVGTAVRRHGDVGAPDERMRDLQADATAPE